MSIDKRLLSVTVMVKMMPTLFPCHVFDVMWIVPMINLTEKDVSKANNERVNSDHSCRAAVFI